MKAGGTTPGSTLEDHHGNDITLSSFQNEKNVVIAVVDKFESAIQELG